MTTKHNQRVETDEPYGNPLRKDLGFRLQDKRLRAGQSVEELANLLGVSPSTVRNWERGKMQLRTIPRLIDFLDSGVCNVS